MNDILTKVNECRAKTPREAEAHYVSAEYHRHWHIVLGTLATIVTALVGTGIFAGLLRQVERNDASRGSFGGLPWLLYLAVAFLSLAAPVLTALHTFLHHAEDAERHKASAAGYNRLLPRFDAFLLRYSGADSAAAKKDEALKVSRQSRKFRFPAK